MFREDEVCSAKRVLGSLEGEFEDQAQTVEEAEEAGDESGEARRAARYFLYRKWVYAEYNFLGKGKRIKIPDCVVEYIRNRFREPGCKCKLGGPLYACKDYVGHRDGPAADEGG